MKIFNIIIYWLMLYLIAGCASTQGIDTKSSLQTPKKIIFHKESTFSKDGLSNFMSSLDEMVKTEKTEEQKEFFQLLDTLITAMAKNDNSIKVVMEIENDTIWKHFIRQDRQSIISDVLVRNDSILYKARQNRKLIPGQLKINLFKESHLYQVTEDFEDKKVIKGLNCHKMTIIKQERSSDLGNRIYELYVTNEINLPLHVVSYIGIFRPQSFPLEITSKNEGLDGIAETYKLVDIIWE